MQPAQPSKAKVIAIAVLGFLLIFILIIGLSSMGSQPKPVVIGDPNDKTNNSSTTSSDVSKTNTKTDTAANTSTVPVTTLETYGVSTQQLNALQRALYNFATANKKNVQNVTMDKASVKHITPDINAGQYYHVYSFTIHIDGTTYDAKFAVIGLNSGRLYLYSPGTSNLVFDSQLIDSSKV